MPKQKTRKTILKRFKITGSGKIMRGHQQSRHRMSHKSKRLRRSYHRKIKLNTEQTKQIKRLISG